jgi:hypothetical protein
VKELCYRLCSDAHENTCGLLTGHLFVENTEHRTEAVVTDTRNPKLKSEVYVNKELVTGARKRILVLENELVQEMLPS